MSKPIKHFLEHCIPPEHRWKIDLFKHWPSIIGPLQERVFIQKIDAGTLYLSTYHPAWAQEVALLTPKLKRSINKLFDEPKVTQIRFCANTPTPQQRIRSEHHDHKQFQQVIGSTTVPLTPHEHQILSQVNNQGLTDALAHYLNRCKTMQRRKHAE